MGAPSDLGGRCNAVFELASRLYVCSPARGVTDFICDTNSVPTVARGMESRRCHFKTQHRDYTEVFHDKTFLSTGLSFLPGSGPPVNTYFQGTRELRG